VAYTAANSHDPTENPGPVARASLDAVGEAQAEIYLPLQQSKSGIGRDPGTAGKRTTMAAAK